ncbi:GspJ family T2SS minor pseudopilin variant LspJ [Legionella spiritensis]|uniref:Type II secretion system protein J n=1 Tax=Legionella spiritensis TaxID=452 RepID=A0A0W0Z4M9_LEGSP|nr:GspJ family T2SS minor pseudopilin variant LspJ [Legionella spiritensis]KTD64104.1 type II secretory pathway protein LspJ [Legionella spiritensis]SNV37835.1 general secretion pathway protein J [Legionella spiritensis]VEG90138.1 general secretion pathway protein J [Legionella spiritensis]
MRNKKGFTLLEVLIALVVFAILATITSSAMYYAFNTRSRVTIQADRLVTLQLAITLIERDVEQVTNRAVRGNEMRLFPTFIGKENYMELTRGGLTNPNSTEKRSTMKRIAILCDQHQLIRRSWPTLDSVTRENYEDKVLLQDVDRCQFGYLNKANDVLSEWHASTLVGNKSVPTPLPRAVRLNLSLSDWGQASFLFILPEGLYGDTQEK